jgi:hypothetical protein
MGFIFAIVHKIVVKYIPVTSRRPGFKKTNLNKKHEAKNNFLIVQSVFLWMERKEMDCANPISSSTFDFNCKRFKNLQAFQFPFLNLKSALGPSMA